MTNTKVNLDNREDDNNDSEELGLSTQSFTKNNTTVVNVDFIGKTSKNRFLKVDFVEIHNNRGNYSTRLYYLNEKNNCFGLFEFLEGYYKKDFDFFISSKKIQSFLLALQKTENEFYKNDCWDYKQFVDFSNKHAIETTQNNKRFSKALNEEIRTGYSIGDEADFYYHEKYNNASIGNHMIKMSAKLVKYYNDYLKEINDKKFCCVCVNNTEKIPPSFFIDPTISLPMILYHEEFAKKFLKNIIKPFISNEIFKLTGIDEISIDLWLVMPHAKISDLIKIIGKDGDIKMNYDETFEDNNAWTIGKYKTLKFNSSMYKGTKEEKHETII